MNLRIPSHPARMLSPNPSGRGPVYAPCLRTFYATIAFLSFLQVHQVYSIKDLNQKYPGSKGKQAIKKINTVPRGFGIRFLYKKSGGESV
jgi:hypothetical protein